MLLRDGLGLLIGSVLILGGYSLSLWQSPYARILGLLTGVTFLGMVAAVLGSAASHQIQLAGLIGISLAASLPVLLAVFFLEMDVSVEKSSATNKWRRHMAEKRDARTAAVPSWEVETVADGDNEKVKVRIRRGEFTRVVGDVDPITDLEGYQKLRAVAQEQASTYESLDVVSESMALQVYDAKQERWGRFPAERTST